MTDNTLDSINSASQDNLIDFKTFINDIMKAKVKDAIDSKRVDVAKNLIQRESDEIEERHYSIKQERESKKPQPKIKRTGGECAVREDAIDEALTRKMDAADIIHDFIHSNDPRFHGKSKKERIKMALGAFYSMHPEKVINEKITQSTQYSNTL